MEVKSLAKGVYSSPSTPKKELGSCEAFIVIGLPFGGTLNLFETNKFGILRNPSQEKGITTQWTKKMGI